MADEILRVVAVDTSSAANRNGEDEVADLVLHLVVRVGQIRIKRGIACFAGCAAL